MELKKDTHAGVRLLDEGDCWVIEDEDYLKFPLLLSSETRTGARVKMDIVTLPDGDVRVARVYYRKGEVDFKIVYQAYMNWIKAKDKEKAKLKQLIEVYGFREM